MCKSFKSQGLIFCPYCSSKSKLYLTGKDYNRLISDIDFYIHKCTSCKLLFLSNPPTDVEKYYISGYHTIPKTIQELQPTIEYQRYKIPLLQKYKAGGDLLEIGPSNGAFAYMAKEAGFKVRTIEIDKTCVDFINNVLEIETIQSFDSASVLKKEKKKYDAICLWHSIEHLPNPFKVLEECVSYLNKDGVLLVAAPNPFSLQARLIGKRWMHHDLPRHLYGFSIKWFMEFAKKYNLQPQLVTTNDVEGRRCSEASWKAAYYKLGLKYKFFSKIEPSFIIKLLSLWDNLPRHGGAFTIVLRK